jgi:hypothetical protein
MLNFEKFERVWVSSARRRHPQSGIQVKGLGEVRSASDRALLRKDVLQGLQQFRRRPGLGRGFHLLHLLTPL